MRKEAVQRSWRGTERVDAATATALREIATSPERIAKLLAGIALRDRRHCDLAVKPSVALFLEAVTDAGINDASELVAFAAEVAKAQSAHAPNVLWLAWIQNNHDAALEGIRRELESWLPADSAPPAAAPSPSAPTKAAPPRRAPAKRPAPARKPAPKKAVKKMK